jgi:aspartate aminotransferase
VDLSLSATLAINEASQARQLAGEAIYKFGLGQSPFPVPQSVVTALQAHAAEKDYLPIRGLLPLRQVVKSYLAQRTGSHYSADNIIIGPGSKELMFILQLVLNHQLVIPQGSWVSYEPQSILAGRSAQWLETFAEDRWCLRPEVLASVANKSKIPLLLILNYPCNPTGQTYSVEQLQALAAVCQAHGIIVLSDEIYGELAFDGQYQSIANYHPDGTIISTGLSKWCGAGGWHLGVFALPEALSRVADGMAIVASETFTAVNAPTQYAAIEAFSLSGEIPRYIQHSRTILKFINDALCDKLQAAGINLFPAAGGFYVMPDFDPLRQQLSRRHIRDSSELCRQLLDATGVALLPGTCFGFPAEKLITRLAFVDFDGQPLLEALENEADDPLTLLAAHPALQKLWAGVAALCEWLPS